MRIGRALAVAVLSATLTVSGTSTSTADLTPRSEACPEPGVPHVPIPGPDVSREILLHLHCLLVSEWGYQLVWDGVFGPATQRAVAAHQRDCGIPPTGRVGPETWLVLHPETTTPECAD